MEEISPKSAELVIMPTEVSHIPEAARNMRKEDADEVMASGNYTPIEALRAAFWSSDFCSTAFLFGDMVGMFGVLRRGSALAGCNIPWLLTTYAVEKYPLAFYKSCKLVVGELLDHYPVMVNMIDARHKRALSWARHLGFQVDLPVPFGPNRMLFCKITIRRIQCVNLSPLALRQDSQLLVP